MNAAAPWARVLLAPWQQRRNQGSVWPTLLLTGGLGLPSLVATATLPSGLARGVSVGVFAVVMAGLWMWLVISLLQQNQPHAARLVPGHLRSLRRVFGGAWLGFTVMAVLLGSAFGHPWAAGAGAATAMLTLAWVVRMPLLGFFFWLVPSTNWRWIDTPTVKAWFESLITSWQTQPGRIVAAGIAVLAVAAVASTQGLFAAGGARHVRDYQRRARQRAAMRLDGAGNARWTMGGGVWEDGVRGAALWGYRRWLERVSRQPDGAVLRRALIGLGPSVHWTGQIGHALTYSAIGGLIVFVVAQVNPLPGALSAASWGLSYAAMTLASSIALQARSTLHGTRHEQALLMLLPGMPRGTALNRGIATRLTVQFLGSWATGTALCVALLPLTPQHAGWFACFAAACLLFGARLWSDWSHLPAPTALSGIVPLLGVALLTAAAIIGEAWLGVPAWATAPALIAAALGLIAWRAWALRGAPSAFPAGRLA